jgi:hypothetical protein
VKVLYLGSIRETTLQHPHIEKKEHLELIHLDLYGPMQT